MQEYEQKQKQEMQEFAKNAVMDTINQMFRNGQISLPSIIDIGASSSNSKSIADVTSTNKKQDEEMMKIMPHVVAAGNEQYTEFSTERLKSMTQQQRKERGNLLRENNALDLLAEQQEFERKLLSQEQE
jgi:hypothetical protein